jgi:hypothetical protein
MTAMPIEPPFIEQPYQRVGVEPEVPMSPIEIPEPPASPAPAPTPPVVVVERPAPTPPAAPAVKPMRASDRLRLRAIAARRYEGWAGLSEDQKQQIVRRMWAAGE